MGERPAGAQRRGARCSPGPCLAGGSPRTMLKSAWAPWPVGDALRLRPAWVLMPDAVGLRVDAPGTERADSAGRPRARARTTREGGASQSPIARARARIETLQGRRCADASDAPWNVIARVLWDAGQATGPGGPPPGAADYPWQAGGVCVHAQLRRGSRAHSLRRAPGPRHRARGRADTGVRSLPPGGSARAEGRGWQVFTSCSSSYSSLHRRRYRFYPSGDRVVR